VERTLVEGLVEASNFRVQNDKKMHVGQKIGVLAGFMWLRIGSKNDFCMQIRWWGFVSYEANI